MGRSNGGERLPRRQRVAEDPRDDAAELFPEAPGVVRLFVALADLPHRNRDLRIARGGNVREEMMLDLMAEMTGQNVEEYGFIEQYKNNPGMQYTYSNWRLPEEKRKEAFEKWKAWREKNPDFGKVTK